MNFDFKDHFHGKEEADRILLSGGIIHKTSVPRFEGSFVDPSTGKVKYAYNQIYQQIDLGGARNVLGTGDVDCFYGPDGGMRLKFESEKPLRVLATPGTGIRDDRDNLKSPEKWHTRGDFTIPRKNYIEVGGIQDDKGNVEGILFCPGGYTYEINY
jgi:hypothetical protein